jgi:hypothetical protein
LDYLDDPDKVSSPFREFHVFGRFCLSQVKQKVYLLSKSTTSYAPIKIAVVKEMPKRNEVDGF